MSLWCRKGDFRIMDREAIILSREMLTPCQTKEFHHRFPELYYYHALPTRVSNRPTAIAFAYTIGGMLSNDVYWFLYRVRGRGSRLCQGPLLA